MRGRRLDSLPTMGELLNLELEQKAVAVRERLAAAVAEYGRVVYSSSLGAESIVLTDIIWSHVPAIDIFTIDTGRLPEETYELLGRLQGWYSRIGCIAALAAGKGKLEGLGIVRGKIQ